MRHRNLLTLALLPVVAIGTLGEASGKVPMTAQAPDVQRVMYLFALAATSTSAEAIAAACGQRLNVLPELEEVRNYKEEARQKISRLPQMTNAKAARYFIVDADSARLVGAAQGGEMTPEECNNAFFRSLSALRNVRQLVIERERALNSNAN